MKTTSDLLTDTMDESTIATVEEFEDALRMNKDRLMKYVNVMSFLINPVSFKDIISEDEQGAMKYLCGINRHEESARMFIEALIKSEDKTKWSVFKEVLEQHEDFELVKDILYCGETLSIITHEEEQKQIQLQRGRLADEFNADILSNRLFQDELLSSQEFEQVSATLRLKGNKEANYDILNMVKRRKGFFHKLLTILYDLGYCRVVRMIDSTFSDKLEAKSKDQICSHKTEYDSDGETTCKGTYEDEITGGDGQPFASGKHYCKESKSGKLGFHTIGQKAGDSSSSDDENVYDDTSDYHENSLRDAVSYSNGNDSSGTIVHTIGFQSPASLDDLSACLVSDHNKELNIGISVYAKPGYDLNNLDDGPVASRTRSRTRNILEKGTKEQLATSSKSEVNSPTMSKDGVTERCPQKPQNLNSTHLYSTDRRKKASPSTQSRLQVYPSTYENCRSSKESKNTASVAENDKRIKKSTKHFSLRDSSMRVCACKKTFVSEEDLVRHQKVDCSGLPTHNGINDTSQAKCINRLNSNDVLNVDSHDGRKPQQQSFHDTDIKISSSVRPHQKNASVSAGRKIECRQQGGNKLRHRDLEDDLLTEMVDCGKILTLPKGKYAAFKRPSAHQKTQSNPDTVESICCCGNKFPSYELMITHRTRKQCAKKMQGQIQNLPPVQYVESRLSLMNPASNPGQVDMVNYKCCCSKKFPSYELMITHRIRNQCAKKLQDEHQYFPTSLDVESTLSATQIHPASNTGIAGMVDNICCCGQAFPSHDLMIIHRTRNQCAKKRQPQSGDLPCSSVVDRSFYKSPEKPLEYGNESDTLEKESVKNNFGFKLANHITRSEERNGTQLALHIEGQSVVHTSNSTSASAPGGQKLSEVGSTDKLARDDKCSKPENEKSPPVHSGFGFQSRQTLHLMKKS